MILEAFEKVLASKWGEFLVPDTDEEGNERTNHPVALAFMALEQNSDEVHGDEVTITPGLEKHWQVLEKEYSISRRAAEVLMILARKYPSVVKVKAPCDELGQIDFREFEAGLEELADAGVLNKTEKNGYMEYELSHDLLASVIFGRNFSQSWKETQSARKSREFHWSSNIEKQIGKMFDDLEDDDTPL